MRLNQSFPKKCQVRARRAADRFCVRLPGLPALQLRLHPPPVQGRGEEKAEAAGKGKREEGSLISKRRCACPHFRKYVPESAICRLRPFFRIKHPELPTELRNGHLTAYSDAAEGRKAELPSRLTDSGASDIIKMTSVSHKKRQKKRRCCRRGRKS